MNLKTIPKVLSTAIWTFGLRCKIVYNSRFYIEDYYQTLNNLSQNKFHSKLKINCLKFLFLYQAFYFFIFFAFQSEMSHRTILLGANFVYLEEIPQFHNIWMVVFMLLGVFFLHLMYYNNNGISARILY